MRTYIYDRIRQLNITSLTARLLSLQQQQEPQLLSDEELESMSRRSDLTTDAMGRNTVIGLLGGGQLGRMLCQAAGPLGIDIAVLDEAKSPAKQAHESGRHVTGSFKDPARIRELAACSDFMSVEIEHVDTYVLEDIEKNGVEVELGDGSKITHRPPVHPSWRTLRLIQDKFLQKEHFRTSKLKIPIAEQMAVAAGDATLESLKEAADNYGFPFMLKARKGSYDGRGNFKVNSADDFPAAIEALGKLSLYAEKWAPFKKELAVMVIRTENEKGELKACVPYPAVETVHEDSICTKVFMPPRQVPEMVCENARQLARNVISTLWGRGVFAVEMFLLEDDSLIVNEVAPRPHNSGHYTIEAVPYMSQYKAQLHAVLDLPIPDKLVPRVSSAIMINILGGAEPNSHHELSKLARETYHENMDVHLHLYGKEPKPGRKIGHITLTGFCSIVDLEALAAEFIKRVDQIRQARIEASAATIRPQEDITNGANGSNGAPSNGLPVIPKVKAPAEREASNGVVSATQPRQVRVQKQAMPSSQVRPLVLVTMGSDSDLPVLKAGIEILEEFKVPYVTRITSAHRTPKAMILAAEQAASEGIKVIIAAAGGAAHLPGMVSSETSLPVIGVPVKASQLDGMDSLLSIVQMPRGVPTATVGINNSTNAALLAIRILGTSIPRFQEKMDAYREKMEKTVLEKDQEMVKLGALGYLAKQQGRS